MPKSDTGDSFAADWRPTFPFQPIGEHCCEAPIMVYSSFALYLLSGPTSVAEEVVTVLGTVLLAAYLCGLWLVPRAPARLLERLPAGE